MRKHYQKRLNDKTMLVKKHLDLGKVFWNIRSQTITTLAIATLIWLLHKTEAIDIALPFSIAGILGSALAIFIAFRNQSSYGRWWEARTIWGGIINSSRIFARQIIANADHTTINGQLSNEKASAFKKEMIYRHIAFVHALRLHLRQQTTWEEITPLLDKNEYEALLKTNNKPNILLHTQGAQIKEAIRSGILEPFDNLTMEPNLATFNNWQGACERIKNTPLPMNYQYFTKLFLYVFIVVLPFSLVGDFFKMGIDILLIPVSFTISFVFCVMNRIGEVNEEPFANFLTDVPLTAMCNTIERDLKEMLGETDLPPKTIPVNGVLN